MPINNRSVSVPGSGPAIYPSQRTQIKERIMNVAGNESPNSADLDRFVSEQNIARYRALLDPNTDESQRRTILLKGEFAKLHETSEIPATQQERLPR